MNQFVKGAKNLVLALSFVSVCACSSVEKDELDTVIKDVCELKNFVDAIKKNKGIIKKDENGKLQANILDRDAIRDEVKNVVSKYIDDINKILVKSCIKKGGIDFDYLKRCGIKLDKCVFVVDDNFSIKYDTLEVCEKVDSNEKVQKFLDVIYNISECGGLLKREDGKGKARLSVSGSSIGFIFGFGTSLDDGVNFVKIVNLIGKLNKEIFYEFFDVSSLEVKDGKICNGSNSEVDLGNLWKQIKMKDGSFEIKKEFCFFEKGIALLLDVDKCEFKLCKADGQISETAEENVNVYIYSGEKGINLGPEK